MINNSNKENIRQLDDNIELVLLGQGNTAEIYKYDDDKIIKLFREQMPLTPIINEFRITSNIQESLSNIPKVYELIKYKNRYGIIYDRVNGTDMIKKLSKNVIRLKHYSQMLGAAHASMHEKSIDVEYSVKDKLRTDIDSCTDLTNMEKEQVKSYLQQLPEGKQICHFDYHPGNIMLSNNSPIVIDWMTACTGDFHADVARTVLLMTTGEMMHINFLKRLFLHFFMRKISKEYLKEYIKLTGISIQDVNRWMLPVKAARLSEWLTDHERARLVKMVHYELKTQNIK